MARLLVCLGLSLPGLAAAQAAWVSQSAPDPRPAGRYGAGAVYDAAEGRVIVWSGVSESVTFRDGWAWDGERWQAWDQAILGVRAYAAFAYDAGAGEFLLFGGRTESNAAGQAQFLGDTWLLADGTWTRRTDAPQPPARGGAAVAYDPAHERVVMFGGSGSLERADTWVWQDGAWSELSALGPSARTAASLAFDSANNRLLLFGGIYSITAQGDTWVLDDEVWEPLQPEHQPPARFGATLVDAGSGRLLLYGGAYLESVAGLDQLRVLADLWRWDGDDWEAVPTDPEATPSPRYFAAAAFDEARRRVVLFGGEDFDGARNDLWELAWARSHYGCAATPASAVGLFLGLTAASCRPRRGRAKRRAVENRG